MNRPVVITKGAYKDKKGFAEDIQFFDYRMLIKVRLDNGEVRPFLSDELRFLSRDDESDLKVSVKGGKLIASASGDTNYPGIDIEYVPDDEENDNPLTRPRVLIEYPNDGKLRALIWDDPLSEDYTREIVFPIK